MIALPIWTSSDPALSYGPRACGTSSSRRRRTWFCCGRPGIDATCSASWFADGTLAEVFPQNNKAGSLPASMENPERLEQILSALPVIESRRDTVKAQAGFLWTAHPSSDPHPTPFQRPRNKPNASCWR